LAVECSSRPKKTQPWDIK
ncbi:hypothetical protein BAE44_0006192, partial [Dichanthelium oligosanthes]